MTIKLSSTLSQFSRSIRFALGAAFCVAVGATPTFAGNIIDISDGTLGPADIQAAAMSRARSMTKSATKLTFGLDTLNSEFQAFQKAVREGKAVAGTFVSKMTMARIVDQRVVIDAVAADDPQSLKRALEALGAEVKGMAGRMISVHMPLERLPVLENLPMLQFTRLALATTRTGSVTSQGDEAQGSDLARLDFGVDGTGSTVGVLSDSFDCAGTGGGYAADIDSGDLPAGVNILDDINMGCIDEGRAMAQIVHDVAPGAGLAFHTAWNGEADFAQGILDLANAGSDIIVDDIIYFAEPMFQDGVIAQAVDQVDAQGIPYFSSAGNNGREAYEAPFIDSGLTGPVGGDLHDFDPGPGVDTRLEISQNADTIYIMQWQDPYFSVSGPPGASTDLDICFYSPPSALTPIGCVTDDNIGGDPIEGASLGGALNLEISVERSSGSDPDPVKMVMFGNITFVDTYVGINAGSVYGHSNAAGANAVGASAYFLTPAFGEDPPVLNYYSSAGNTPILFDTAGNPILEVREKPEFTAPDGGNNTFFGGDYEPDGWPNFFGTSAAAPHAAAVAALMREMEPALTPVAITARLQDTAVDILERETLGFGGPRVAIDEDYDNDSGSGLIDAQEALIPPEECNLIASPMTLDFGAVLFGETSTEIVELQNSGIVACNVSELYVINEFCLIGTGFALNLAAPTPPFPVDAGGSVSIPVDYSPCEEVGADTGTLVVMSDDPDNPKIEVTLIGDVIPPEADLSITKTDSPDPAKIGSDLTYTITVTNQGPDTATGVIMTDKLPSRTAFVSVITSQGSCSGTNTVICDLASLAADSSAVVEIIVKPTKQGRLLNTAAVEAVEDDPDSSNNSATEITRVRNARP
ncbi:MAG: choice-of-anchor D domain-containing protein [Pseudomonadota bacterium]